MQNVLKKIMNSAITMRATTIMMKMGAMTTSQAATIVIAYLPSNLDKFSKSNSS